MSPENLELVRSMYAAQEGGDFSRSADWARPEIESCLSKDRPPAAGRGWPGMAEAYGEFLRTWGRRHAGDQS